MQAGAPLVGFLHRSRLSCTAEVLVSLWSKHLSALPSPEFLYPFPPDGMHPALFFSPLGPNPSEYLCRAVLLSPQEDMACFLLLFHFFPSLHGQFNHIHETSTVFHLGAEITLPETAEKTYKALCLFSSNKGDFCKKVMKLQS